MRTEKTTIQELLRKDRKLEAQGKNTEAAVLREEIEARLRALREVRSG